MTVQRSSDLYAPNLKNVLEIDCLSGTLIGLGRVRGGVRLHFACVIVSLLLEDNLCAYDCYVNIMVFPIVNALAGRLLGAYDLGVATPRAVVHVGDKTSGDAKSWVKGMIVKIEMCDSRL
ncbi:hypothetical protein Tco_0123347 [Tanacetum coccineum]